MTGMSSAELADPDRRTAHVIVPALLFVLGFSFVFVALGASASVLGGLLAQYRPVLEKVGGLLVIGFGVLMLGVVKVPWLYGEARAEMSSVRAFGKAAALVMGMAFAAGWTPCVGPILGTILGLASASVALLFDRAAPLLRWLGRHSLVVNRAAGSVLIAIGLLILTGRLTVLATWLTRFVPTIGV